VLWLNNNQITTLTGLDENIRIKYLYGMHNNINSLIGSVQKFKFLRVLNLSHNNLKDLNLVLKLLERNPYLQELYLDGNPVAEETNYKMRVLNAIPSLEVLDR
jgi:Leucine-rich repeat (LRR) protein